MVPIHGNGDFLLYGSPRISAVIPTLHGSDSVVLGHLWSQNDCHYIMVEAESQLKLLHTYTLDVYNVFEHIDVLSVGIWH
jgi:hypothetical protein